MGEKLALNPSIFTIVFEIHSFCICGAEAFIACKMKGLENLFKMRSNPLLRLPTFGCTLTEGYLSSSNISRLIYVFTKTRLVPHLECLLIFLLTFSCQKYTLVNCPTKRWLIFLERSLQGL